MNNIKDEFYTISAKCFNCKWRGVLEILKGKTIDKEECPNCGCQEIGRDDVHSLN